MSSRTSNPCVLIFDVKVVQCALQLPVLLIVILSLPLSPLPLSLSLFDSLLSFPLRPLSLPLSSLYPFLFPILTRFLLEYKTKFNIVCMCVHLYDMEIIVIVKVILGNFPNDVYTSGLVIHVLNLFITITVVKRKVCQ